MKNKTAQRVHFRALIRLLQALIISCVMVFSTYASELKQPTGPVLLEISGNLSHHNTKLDIDRQEDGQEINAVALDLKMLETLPVETIRTKTPWTEGVVEFTGVRLDVLLNFVGAESNDLLFQALDEYSVEASNEPFESFPIIVAYKRNGKYMSVRELGPLWIMYPFDEFPELNTEQSRANCVWQLTNITVK